MNIEKLESRLEDTHKTVAVLRGMLEESLIQEVCKFLITIGKTEATKICAMLDEQTLETITFEIARREYLTESECQNILEMFCNLYDNDNFIVLGGINYAKDLMTETVGEQKAIDILNRMSSSLQIKPFDYIRRCHPIDLLNIIQQEHPQVIALILSYLEPNKASIMLQNLPAELRSDITRRIACMDSIEPETLREVERVLEKKLSTLSAEDYWRNAGGLPAVVEILNLVDREVEKQVIENLEDEDPELAEEIKKRMFIFEDIVMLNDHYIQKILRNVDSQELAKALFNVDSEVQNKIFRNFSKRAEAMLKEDMIYMGPLKLKDIEEAQQKIVSIIRKLEEDGEISLNRCGENEMISPNLNIDEKVQEQMKKEHEENKLILNSEEKHNFFWKLILRKIKRLTNG